MRVDPARRSAAFAALLCALWAPAVASAYSFSFDRSFAAPDANLYALGVGDGGSLWVHGQDTQKVYELDPATGSLLGSFATSIGTIADIDVLNGVLYAGAEPEIYRYNAATGASLGALTGPVTGGSRGLSFIGLDLYVSGVLTGFPGDVRLGEVDASDGSLLASSAPVDLIDSAGIGALEGQVLYLAVDTSSGTPYDVVLRVADPVTGAAVESHLLFTSDDTLFGLDVQGDELFVTRRDVSAGEIWVYQILPEPGAPLSLAAGLAMLAALARGRRPLRRARAGTRRARRARPTAPASTPRSSC